uniref:Uncharacterized protein n=1 Tax=Lepeophtheirus salmonis TaxID=72036 RepID=A0A0K2UV84_LEPSM
MSNKTLKVAWNRLQSNYIISM